MGQTAKLVLIALALLLIGIVVGGLAVNTLSDAYWSPQVVSYKARIDSMQVVVDSTLAQLEMEYAKNQRVIVKTKIQYITKIVENEKKEYFALDTVGRVEHFRGWVRDLTYKPNQYDGRVIDEGIDKPLREEN